MKEHKAKPRRMEGLSGIITPDAPRRGAAEFSAHSRMVGQQPVLCQVRFVEPSPANSWGGSTHSHSGCPVLLLHHPPAGRSFPNVQCDPPKPQLLWLLPLVGKGLSPSPWWLPFRCCSHFKSTSSILFPRLNNLSSPGSPDASDLSSAYVFSLNSFFSLNTSWTGRPKSSHGILWAEYRQADNKFP